MNYPEKMMLPVNFLLCVIIANMIIVAQCEKTCSTCNKQISEQLLKHDKTSKEKPTSIKLPLNAGNANCFLTAINRINLTEKSHVCPQQSANELTYDVEVLIEGLRLHCDIKDIPETDTEKSLYNVVRGLAALTTGKNQNKIIVIKMDVKYCITYGSLTSKKIDLYPEMFLTNAIVKFNVVVKDGQTKIVTAEVKSNYKVIVKCNAKDGDTDRKSPCKCIFNAGIEIEKKIPLVGSLLTGYGNDNGFASLREALTCKG